MANERTEKATPKREGDARKKGQIPKSADLNSAIMLCLSMYLIYIFSSSIMTQLKQITVATLTNLDPTLISRENFHGFFSPYISVLFSILMPILLILLVCGVVINYIQIGFLFSLETIKPDFSKLNPADMIKGLKRIFLFDVKTLVELLKSLLKMLIVGWISYVVIMAHKDELLNLLGAEIPQSLAVISAIIFELFSKICIMLLFLGIVDKKYQSYEYDKSLKMTKEEVKDERKNSEGDPQVKAKIKSIQYKFALQRMSSAVPKADVIVTNPTHYAVAIKYDTSVAPAPQVIAKGVDYVAFKIKEIAQNNNIPIVENKPLARTLYKVVPLDGLIPADLYVAVAELLAYVYKTGKGK
jgi:flagellar biosynthetic protein FlhB